jgi:hypothetical protein
VDVAAGLKAEEMAAGVLLFVDTAGELLPPHPTRAAATARTPRSRPRRRFIRIFISILRTVTSQCACEPVGGAAQWAAKSAARMALKDRCLGKVSQLIAAKLRAYARGFITRSHVTSHMVIPATPLS